MIVTVYDTETNGLDTKNGFIQELAWATYKVSFLSEWRLITSKSYLLKWDQDYSVDQKALEITGIDKNFCQKHGNNPVNVFHDFLKSVQESDFLAGQNAMLFDSKIVDSNMTIAEAQSHYQDYSSTLLGKLKTSDFYHVDSYFDIHGPIKPKSLKYFALDHGYVLNNAHSAIHDVFACAHILSKYHIAELTESAKIPLVKTSVTCDYQNKNLKEQLYANGFRWNPDSKNYSRIGRLHINDVIVQALKVDLRAVHQEVLFDACTPQTPSPQQSESHDNTLADGKNTAEESDQLLFPES